MGISANKLTQDNPAAVRVYSYRGGTAISLTNVSVARFKPGMDGEIVWVRACARTVNGASVPEVRVTDAATAAGQNVLTGSLSPNALAAASPSEGTLQVDRRLRRFTRLQEITVHVTTGGTAPVDFHVEVGVRPFPLNGEAR